MTLQIFLFAVFGKQKKREVQDKKLGMEVLQEIGIQRFVHSSMFAQMANCNYKILLYYVSLSAFLNQDVNLSLHVC